MINVQNVMDELTASVDPIAAHIDGLKFGHPQTEVKGIAITFMATQQVLEQAVKLGANFIITHEGTFFSHHDQVDSMYEDDLVYKAKKRFIEENGLAIYRFHDYWHRYQPDGVMEGLIHALDWQEHVTEYLPSAALATIPPMKLEQVVGYVKKQLGLRYVRIAGDLSMNCSRIGLLVGYRGAGQNAIPLFAKHQVDVILYGEGPEWETPEYVRDALYIGKRNALIVLGHSESEQPGMKLLADRLSLRYPHIPVHYMPVDSVFRMA
ncbi:Nif3-like dinuclear metal center hexameric protein [Paenibacillus sp. PL91]|uniref:Nif3-like dinuclear metal center hexameric protein n=1 Tax=Paenibacillus sp. PL91 TaxID=2729538 RepID=UPI00145D69F9|nr:Nif3-like dinuclear metal center hexameric protein [Paenibacillus sp. PL91]MBC9202458.1 Nif3-like dinuclear metal center hexameric protein [Paenibacillus sp. PL91]